MTATVSKPTYNSTFIRRGISGVMFLAVVAALLVAVPGASSNTGQSTGIDGQSAPMERADNELERVSGASRIAEGPGVYFLNLATSLVDGWRQPGFAGYDLNSDSFVRDSTLLWAHVAVSDDNLLIALPDGSGGGLLIDRTRSAVYRWSDTLQHLESDDGVLAAAGNVAVFQSVDSIDKGRFLVVALDPNPTVVAAFDGEPTSRALVAADGKKIVIGGPTPRVFDIQSGSSYAFEGHPDAYSFILQAVPAVDGFVHLAAIGGEDELIEMAWSTRDWKGQPLAAGTLDAIPVSGFHLSADGERLAWTTLSDSAVDPETTVKAVDTTNGILQFSVPGADTCYESSGGSRWLADASALVVRTSDGYAIASGSSTLKPLGIEQPVPSPESNDVFARGTQVFHGNGSLVAGVAAPEWIRPRFPAWGTDGSEVRVVTMAVGREAICEDSGHDHSHSTSLETSDVPAEVSRRIEFLWGADLDVYVDNPGDCTTQTTGDHSYNATWGYARDLGSCTSSNWKYYLDPYGLDSSFVVGYVSATEYSGSLYQRSGASCTGAVTGQYGITIDMREYSEITGLYRIVGKYRLLHMSSVASVGTFVNDAGVIGQPDGRTWLYTSTAGNCQGDSYLYSSARHVHWWKLPGSGFSAWWTNPATYILYYN